MFDLINGLMQFRFCIQTVPKKFSKQSRFSLQVLSLITSSDSVVNLE